MRIGVVISVVALGAMPVLSCAHPKKTEALSTSAIADYPENKPFGDIDHDAIDESVSPCSDFYAYACGGFTKTAKIPDDQGWWSRSFHEARARNEKILRTILERDAVDPPADDPYSTQLGDFYASCMDETAIDARGDDELITLLDDLKTSDADSLARTVAHLHLLGVPALFVLEPEADLRDARLVSAVVRQPPIANASDPIEEKIFSAFEARAVFHDANAAPIIVDASGLAKIAPNFRWKIYFSELGISPPSAIHVATPNYLSALDRLVREFLGDASKREALRTTLRAELLHSLAAFSSRAVSQADLEKHFDETRTRTLPARSTFCVRAADALLGEALAIPFARESLSDDDVARARVQTETLRAAMLEEIDSLDWMDEATRALARNKLRALSVAIGIPAEKPAYGAISTQRASFFRDVVLLRKIVAQKNLTTIGHPTDPSAWRFPGTTANAYFDPRKNEMVIPAGILTPPIFDARDRFGFAFDDIVGHELTHALDRRFDEMGNATVWWSDATAKRYGKKLECVRRDLEAQSTLLKIDLHVNQILDESIADSGGLRLAYRAASREHSSNDKARDQAFFTAYAQLWCSAFRPEALTNYAAENPHPPPRVRVNRALADMPELASAFSCNEGSTMTKMPRDRCDVW